MSARDLADAIGALASIVADAADTSATRPEGGLLAALDAVGELGRRVGALGVALTAACDAYRSRDGDTLPMRTGMRDVATLVSVRTGLDAAEASRWASVAAATAPRTSLAGQTLPAAHPRVADALAAGTLSVDGAARICATLADAAVAVDAEVAEGLERTLVDYAPTLTARELRRLCRQVLDRCTPEDADLREEALRVRSGLRMTRLPDGSARWILTLHPEAEGLLRTAIDARTAPRRPPTFAEEGETVIGDPGPLHQRRLDALVGIARTALSADDGRVAGSPVTMLVTVDLEALRSGIGTAEIAGVDEPISAGPARRSPPTRRSSRSSSAPRASRSTSDAEPDSPPPLSAGRSRCGMAGARGAGRRRAGARWRTGSPGSSAGAPISTTSCCSARRAIGSSIATGGSSSGGTASPGSSRPRTSTPPAHPAAAMRRPASGSECEGPGCEQRRGRDQ